MDEYYDHKCFTNWDDLEVPPAIKQPAGVPLPWCPARVTCPRCRPRLHVGLVFADLLRQLRGGDPAVRLEGGVPVAGPRGGQQRTAAELQQRGRQVRVRTQHGASAMAKRWCIQGMRLRDISRVIIYNKDTYVNIYLMLAKYLLTIIVIRHTKGSFSFKC